MTQGKWFLHPISIFVFSIIALGTSLFLYIYWYMEANKGLRVLVEKFNLDSNQILTAQTWVVIMVLSILVSIILIGIFTIFVYSQKILQLYRLQNNFINNFTHELKTPVTSLKLYLQTFGKYELPRHDQLKYMQYMLHDVARLSENIDRILNLAKIESGSYDSEMVEIDIVEVIEIFLKENRHLFQNCHIQIHNPTGQTFLYSINLSLFDMLLMNLMINAIKYNDSKAPTIDITIAPIKNEIHICFKDNGIGFEKGEIKKIFRKFYQIGRSKNMTAKGTGLGLHLVQTIARIHKGKVSAQSNGSGSGSGSTFTLMLPLKA
jgi:two-component system, OmpR family, phosphate regulon sensor histidine kinase PhoR